MNEKFEDEFVVLLNCVLWHFTPFLSYPTLHTSDTDWCIACHIVIISLPFVICDMHDGMIDVVNTKKLQNTNTTTLPCNFESSLNY